MAVTSRSKTVGVLGGMGPEATVDFAAFPDHADGELRYCASNQVGDAVLLRALVQGPLWQRIARRP